MAMTKTQIKNKLIRAGIPEAAIMEVRSGQEVEIGVMVDGKRYCDSEESYRLAKIAMDVLGWKNGVATGYNSWIIEGHTKGASARFVNSLDQLGLGAYE